MITRGVKVIEKAQTRENCSLVSDGYTFCDAFSSMSDESWNKVKVPKIIDLGLVWCDLISELQR